MATTPHDTVRFSTHTRLNTLRILLPLALLLLSSPNTLACDPDDPDLDDYEPDVDACYSGGYDSIELPYYYIFDAHNHPIGDSYQTTENGSNLYERDTFCALATGDLDSPSQAAVSCGLGGVYYNYDTILDKLHDNGHISSSGIKRTLGIGGTWIREYGYSAVEDLCDFTTIDVNCEADLSPPVANKYRAAKFADNTPDLRLKQASQPASDPYEVVASLASFGACDTSVSPTYVDDNAPSFRWAGEKYDRCWNKALYDNSNDTPTAEVLDIFDLLAWDDDYHGTVLSTHLELRDLPYSSLTIPSPDTPLNCNSNSHCERFQNAVDIACGDYDLALHMTHGNIVTAHVDENSLAFLEYWFRRYDCLKTPQDECENGFFAIDLQYAMRHWLPYSEELAVEIPCELLDFMLDETNSRHLTIGSHIYGAGNNFVTTDNSWWGSNYTDWKDYWDTVFKLMKKRAIDVYGSSPGATIACEAIQNISHRNMERFLSPIPGTSTFMPELAGVSCP